MKSVDEGQRVGLEATRAATTIHQRAASRGRKPADFPYIPAVNWWTEASVIHCPCST